MIRQPGEIERTSFALIRDELRERNIRLDPENEAVIQNAIGNLIKDKTVIIIAHRLSTVRNADWIMVMEQGRIVEKGTHDQLIEMKGRYYTLYTGNSIA